ncbi:hypothetical protein CCZ01_04945 [Helicobacter monodelphidis]|uniref:response regulator n=1 Tax=Helicobacter sp. 15-1451 TaxID=2004995 RepID=UPI000DCBC285|nr:response regulator [Helicobacter sp. 15-1451]RAX57797.1 hypothetical protein CCZ01_04945 [Helicobacter sp. 15-1451]
MSVTSSDRSLFELTLLYAEDDKSIQEMMKKILQRRFCKVLCANDGEGGFDLFQKENIDIVITDMSMPKVSGLELCAKIREIDEEIPIMMITAFNESDYLIEALQLGVDRFLFKPINTTTLDKHLKILVKRAILSKKNLTQGVS